MLEVTVPWALGLQPKMTILYIFYTTITCFAKLKLSSNVRVSTMANLKAEFHEPLLVQALNMIRR